MALLNSTYSLQQGFYAAGVFPAPMPNYSGFSVVAGLRMQPPFGALSTAAAMGQLAAFPGGSAAAVAAAASFGMEHFRAGQGLRPIATLSGTAAASPPGSFGDKRSGVTDFSIDGILGNRDSDEHTSTRVTTSSSSSLRIKHKLGGNIKRSHHQSYQFQSKSLALMPMAPKDDSQIDDHDHEMATSKMTEDDDDNDHQDSKADPDDGDNPMTRFSWLQCTRYKPPRLPRTKRKEGAKKRKLGRNPRVPFSPTQVATLEQKFRCTHYLSSIDVAELSAALNLSENRVKIWFQNRRARERRDKEGTGGVESKTQQASASATSNNNTNHHLLTPGPSPLSHSPHTPLSPLSSASSSSPSSASSGMSIPPFASPGGIGNPSLASSTPSSIAMARLSSPLMSIECAAPHSASSPSSLSSPLSFTSSSSSAHHDGGVAARRSPTPTGLNLSHHHHHHIQQQQHQLQHHHHSPTFSASEPGHAGAGSAFTLVSHHSSSVK